MLSIFIGYIFVFFHFRINGFDILANFAGYVLIFLGLCQLAHHAPALQKAKPYAIAMAVMSFISAVAGVMGYYNDFIPLLIMNIVSVAVSVYLLLLVDTGILEMEQALGADLEAVGLLKIWRFQATFTVASTAFSLVPTTLFSLLTAALAIGAIVANVIFLYRLLNAKAAYSDMVRERNGL